MNVERPRFLDSPYFYYDKQGRKDGRPKKRAIDVDRAIKLYDTKEYTVTEIEGMTGVSKATLYRELNKRKGVS